MKERYLMSNVIIGTAGHIDHGKTTLIKALSGIETDTMTEEKERGISINLGFAYFDLPSGKRCGVVDVPGHEKFIKNMLVGAVGINLVLLLVDAREGIMPQTKEHADILSLLGVENFIIVMTKIDLADEDYRTLVREDIESFIKGTPLEGSPIVEVDSVSRKGIDELLHVIDKKTDDIAELKNSGNVRLNIDRAFQVKGFGTVITGTLTEGMISVGDELEVYPHDIKTKVRNIQVHKEDVKTAYAGQRTAINLTNIKVEDIGRGCSLATPGTLTKTYMLDTEVQMIKNSGINLELWDRVRVYTGTSEVMARFVPLGGDILEEGSKGFAQLRLEEEIAVKNYDKFIIRTYSPMITIGGGVILDCNPKKHNRFNDEILNKLKIQSKGSSKDLIANYILLNQQYLVTADKIAKALEKSSEEVLKDLDELLEEKTVYVTKEGYIHSKKYEDVSERIAAVISDYHNKFKLKKGMSKAELISKFKMNQKEFAAMVELLSVNKVLKIEGNFVSIFDFSVKYDDKQMQEKKRIEKTLLESAFTPPTIKELTKGNKVANEVLDSLLGDTVIRLNEDIVIHVRTFDEAKNKVLKHFEGNKKLLLSEFRDMTGSTRKYALPILEYMDKAGVTKRVEDYRVKGNEV